MTSTETTERHSSYGFITEHRNKPGEFGMRKYEDAKLREVTEEYEQKAHLLTSQAREIIERLAAVGRDEIEQRANETQES